MPLIEELPVTSTIKASHGWAYVPDTGPIAAQQPGARDRKRAAAATTKHTANASAKQQKAIQQRLDSLNKENFKDGVTVPIPARSGASAREKAGKKITPNVRRILTYQRGFAHYLADEEANNPGAKHYQLPNLASGMAPPPAPAAALVTAVATPLETKTQKNASKDDGRRKSGTARTRASTNEGLASQPSTPVSQPRGKKRGRPSLQTTVTIEEIESPAPTSKEQEAPVKSEDVDTVMLDAEATASDPPKQHSQPEPQDHPDQENPSSPTSYPPEWDLDPLLTTTPDDVPRMPSDKVMRLLMSEPPLTYNAARATQLDPDKQPPPRHFCGVCGYWGRVKCRKCEEWTCGIMECWRGHEAVCVVGNMYG